MHFALLLCNCGPSANLLDFHERMQDLHPTIGKKILLWTVDYFPE